MICRTAANLGKDRSCKTSHSRCSSMIKTHRHLNVSKYACKFNIYAQLEVFNWGQMLCTSSGSIL